MPENLYDNHEFNEKYAQMERSVIGLEAAGEWPQLKELLGDMKDKDFIDLGCGYGWHCAYAVTAGAKSVVGIDQSEKMLSKAMEIKHADQEYLIFHADIVYNTHSRSNYNCKAQFSRIVYKVINKSDLPMCDIIDKRK